MPCGAVRGIRHNTELIFSLGVCLFERGGKRILDSIKPFDHIVSQKSGLYAKQYGKIPVDENCTWMHMYFECRYSTSKSLISMQELAGKNILPLASVSPVSV